MDAHLRVLQRAWEVEGTPAAAARYLHTYERLGSGLGKLLRLRVEVGGLPLERVRQAAQLGDPAARQALPKESFGQAFSRSHHELSQWLRRLADWDQEALVRASLVAATAAVEAQLERRLGLFFSWSTQTWEEPAPREALTALRRWILTIPESTADETGQWAHEALRYEVALAVERVRHWQRGRRSRPSLPCWRSFNWMRRVLSSALRAAATKRRESCVGDALTAIRYADRWATAVLSGRAAKRASLGRGRVRNAIRQALVPWLLRTGDPLLA